MLFPSFFFFTYFVAIFTAPIEQSISETPTPTKEELLTQLQTLQQQIEAL